MKNNILIVYFREETPPVAYLSLLPFKTRQFRISLLLFSPLSTTTVWGSLWGTQGENQTPNGSFTPICLCNSHRDVHFPILCQFKVATCLPSTNSIPLRSSFSRFSIINALPIPFSPTKVSGPLSRTNLPYLFPTLRPILSFLQ